MRVWKVQPFGRFAYRVGATTIGGIADVGSTCWGVLVTTKAQLDRYRLRVRKSFAELLPQLIRDRLYDSPSAFARDAGVSESSVSRWIAGKERPGNRTIEKIAPKLGLTVAELSGVVYGTDAQGPAVEPTAYHPLALEIARLLGDDSPLPPDRRDILATLIDGALAPYRRDLRRRTAR